METHFPRKRPSYDVRMDADPTRLLQPTFNINAPPHDPGFYDRLKDHYANAADRRDREDRRRAWREIRRNGWLVLMAFALGATVATAAITWGVVPVPNECPTERC